jgi:hypothetical protein
MSVKATAYLRDRWKRSAEESPLFDLVVSVLLLALTWVAVDSKEFWGDARGIVLALAALVVAHYLNRAWRFVFTVPKQEQEELIKQMARIETRQEEKYAIYLAGQKALEAENAKLKNLLEDKKRDQAFADALTEMYQRGLHDILNRPVGSSTSIDWGVWKLDEVTWTAQVRGLLTDHGCSKQEISHFRELHEVEHKGYHTELLIDHQKSMFSLRLKRLKTIINLYAETKVLKDY